MKQDNFLEIANANKFEGYWNGIPFYSNPNVPDGIIYFVNEDVDIEHFRKMGQIIKKQPRRYGKIVGLKSKKWWEFWK